MSPGSANHLLNAFPLLTEHPQSPFSPKQSQFVGFTSLDVQLLLLSPRGWRTQILGIRVNLQGKSGSLTGEVNSYQQFFPVNKGKGLSGVFSNLPRKVSI